MKPVRCTHCSNVFWVLEKAGPGRPRERCRTPECEASWKREQYHAMPPEQKERHLERMRANTARARQTKTGATTVFSPPFLASTR